MPRKAPTYCHSFCISCRSLYGCEMWTRWLMVHRKITLRTDVMLLDDRAYLQTQVPGDNTCWQINTRSTPGIFSNRCEREINLTHLNLCQFFFFFNRVEKKTTLTGPSVLEERAGMRSKREIKAVFCLRKGLWTKSDQEVLGGGVRL